MPFNIKRTPIRLTLVIKPSSTFYVHILYDFSIQTALKSIENVTAFLLAFALCTAFSYRRRRIVVVVVIVVVTARDCKIQFTMLCIYIICCMLNSYPRFYTPTVQNDVYLCHSIIVCVNVGFVRIYR